MTALQQQIEYQEEIQKIGLNLIVCNNCENVLFHKKDEDYIKCPDCETYVNPNDCCDVYYTGME